MAKSSTLGIEATVRGAKNRRALGLVRRFTVKGVHPFDTLSWQKRDATISNDAGKVIFEQKGVEVPSIWSQLATNVVVSKYFRGAVGSPEREYSVKQLIGRVVRTIREWGLKGGYLQDTAEATIFADELTHILVNQLYCFNSPVWFNVGIERKPQCSACFINSVEDTMESILDLAKTEGMLFKWGSGTGTNLSPIRSSRERLSSGGTPSGPVSFMRGYDAFASVIKSGGKTRRAAKMQILNVDHPDITDFVACKAKEEKKAWALIEQGYDPSFNGEAYHSVFFQNANLSVRVSDAFMYAVLEDKDWTTRSVTTGAPSETFKARELLRRIAEGTWICGDPGMQFDTTINDWHTCSNTARISASNPCSEYMFLDDSACNLGSLNLMKFRREDGDFDVDGFRHAVDLAILAQEILIDFASYPTRQIERNSHMYRPLGLGYANLGSLIMSRGLPYDSDAGRNLASAVTALMGGQAYLMSARIARRAAPFEGYETNRRPFLRVIAKHRNEARRLTEEGVPTDLLAAARQAWEEAALLGKRHGFRNAQVTVLAPTGTIAFMMDCDTTGIEPDIALVKYKKLVGGGLLKMVNHTVPTALARLGYAEEAIQRIVHYVDEHETIEGAPDLDEAHIPVFDCAFKPVNGSRSIHYTGHIKMMAAAQPFLSGAISKTVNLPREATAEEIAETYIMAWKMGLKAVAIYRDGCKRTQPLNAGKAAEGKGSETKAKAAEPARPVRRRLPDERAAITHKFSVGGHEGYLTVGMYNDGAPGEIFITMAKEGSTISGLMDTIATATSIALQYGVPLHVLAKKFSHTRFEPSGFTGNPDIPIAKSVIDYVFRWLTEKFLPATGQGSAPQTAVLKAGHNAQPRIGGGNGNGNGAAAGANGNGATAAMVTIGNRLVAIPDAAERSSTERSVFTLQADAPPCHNCGEIMVRNAACYKCLNCGETSGCS